jgi:hypothetical protein
VAERHGPGAGPGTSGGVQERVEPATLATSRRRERTGDAPAFGEGCDTRGIGGRLERQLEAAPGTPPSGQTSQPGPGGSAPRPVASRHSAMDR